MYKQSFNWSADVDRDVFLEQYFNNTLFQLIDDYAIIIGTYLINIQCKIFNFTFPGKYLRILYSFWNENNEKDHGVDSFVYRWSVFVFFSWFIYEINIPLILCSSLTFY